MDDLCGVVSGEDDGLRRLIGDIVLCSPLLFLRCLGEIDRFLGDTFGDVLDGLVFVSLFHSGLAFFVPDGGEEE